MATGGGMDENDWQKLPVEQKVQHKAWKARLTGYEECVKLFRSQSSDQSPEFARYLPLMKKFVLDANENAREKALDAVFAFVEEANVAGKTVNEVAAGLISKCLNARSKMKERALEILLMYVEIEKPVEVEEELVKGLENKQPKIVQACLEVLRRGLSEFGSKILPIKPFIKQVIPLLDDRDKTVRDESKLLIIEIYKWIGKQTLTPLIQNVKAIQMQELQSEFDKLDVNGKDKPKQTRFLRSQQELKDKPEEIAESPAVISGEMNVEMQEDFDPFEMLEPVNILERLSKDFFEKLESKQWKDRKEALDDLLSILTQNPKPTADTDYAELIKALRKIIAKDSNIPVVLATAKCLSALAQGLRKAFKTYAIGVIEVSLDRCREKKSNVIDTLRETCDASYPSINLEQFSEASTALLAHKTPVVRQCTQQFLIKCFSMATHMTLPKKTLKIFLPALIKNTGEADPSVRDSAFEGLGMLWKCLGEKHIRPNLTDLDELKLNKIKEYAAKSVLLNLRGEPRSTAPIIEQPVSPPPVEQKIIKKEPKPPQQPPPPPPPVPVVKKKPIVVAPPKPPTPKIPPVPPRTAPIRAKPPAATTVKVPPAKSRPATAPMPKSTTTSNLQTRTQRLVPVVLPSTTKARSKAPVAANRRSSIGANLSPITPNLERQSTSTGGSTSSLSSTNTQASTRSETPTSSATAAAILRSVSNDIISSPNPLSVNAKSRIPVRTIPIAIGKKSSA